MSLHSCANGAGSLMRSEDAPGAARRDIARSCSDGRRARSLPIGLEAPAPEQLRGGRNRPPCAAWRIYASSTPRFNGGCKENPAAGVRSDVRPAG